MRKPITIDCISDLHGNYPKLNGGDLLIVAGDLTAHDRLSEYEQFDQWIRMLNYRKKIVIGGNHDNHLVNGYQIKYAEYLCDSGTKFGDFKIWGSPWVKRFEGMNPKAMAFTVDTDEALAEKWRMIPEDTDILVTHCPPWGILDLIEKLSVKADNEHKFVGSLSLREATMKIKPKLMVFGHIHECGGGIIDLVITKFINASHVNEHYEPINKPTRIEL